MASESKAAPEPRDDRREALEQALDAHEIAVVEAAAAYLARDWHWTPKSVRRHSKASDRAERTRAAVLAAAGSAR